MRGVFNINNLCESADAPVDDAGTKHFTYP